VSPRRLVDSALNQSQAAFALQYGVVRHRENDDTGLANIDRRIRGHIAADHDIDQANVRQICDQEVQIFGAGRTIRAFGRPTLLVMPQ
jgi:hypothetical protein